MPHIDDANRFDAEAILAVADGEQLTLGSDLLASVDARSREMRERLLSGDAVYGVTTGMGAASEVRLDAAAQAAHQNTLMLARAVGSAPWLSRAEARAAVAVRLRTFLTLDAGVSAGLCSHLVDLLNRDLVPAIPRTRLGAAGEIIPLAHLGGAVNGTGVFLPSADGSPGTGTGLSEPLAPYSFGPKEGVAMLEGVPVTTALALLRVRDARALATQAIALVASEIELVGASRDPFSPTTARGDAELEQVLAAVLRLAGDTAQPRALQAPLSFRVLGPAVAHLLRAADAVAAAADRGLTGVTDSPAYLDDPHTGTARFIGTAGFDGFDLAATLDALRVSVIHLAELSAARTHRLLDDRFTGLPRQLSDRPGLHAGMVAVHKRAVGVTHELLGASRPASLGTIETSLGQEDVQSFSMEAAVACDTAITGARDVFACELLAVVQASRLAGRTDAATPAPQAGEVARLVSAASAVLPTGTGDRAFGLDVERLTQLLADGWAL